MMRGGRDEERLLSPMFPRLHVNDADKGGPRAPPRNKMALYEQFSIPSHRSGSGSISILPLRPNNSSGLVPSISPTNGGDHERSVFLPFCNSPEPSNLAEKLHSYSSTGVKLNIRIGTHERKPTQATDHPSLHAMSPMPTISKCNPLQQHDFSNLKNFSLKKSGNGDDLRVPTCGQSGINPNCSKGQQSKDQEKVSKLKLTSTLQLQTVTEKHIKGNDAVDLKSRRYMRNQVEENARMLQNTQKFVDRAFPSSLISSIRDKSSADASLGLSTSVKNSESLKRSHASLNQQNKSSSVDVLNSLDGTNALLYQECVGTQDRMVSRDNIVMEPGRGINRENASKVRSESCLRPSLGADNKTSNGLENIRAGCEEKNNVSAQVGSIDRQDVSATSMMECTSPLDISTDHVVELMGKKEFWKLRGAIVNQQRVFAVQVFELHRLIKVQKLIAQSPHLLLEDTLYMGKPSLDVTPMKKLTSDNVHETALNITDQDNSQEPNPSIECADENAIAKLLSPVNNDTSKGLITQRINCGPYLGKSTATPLAVNNTTPWCFSPPGNQWLVPVMSPSEGLVYKPYTGPCPPTAGFMGPVYGSCGPVNLAAGGVDFLKTACGLPASHQQGIGSLPGTPALGQTYFPHYGMPVMNTSISGSAVEQMSPFTGVQSKANHLPVGNITVPHQSSSNMSSQMSRAISYRVRKLPPPKESEIQGSTASSPAAERTKGNALPLFPTEPMAQASDQNALTNEHQARVIKVVPHTPRLATESAARIFKSIQEERKQYD